MEIDDTRGSSLDVHSSNADLSLLHSLPHQSSCDPHTFPRSCIECDGQAVAGDREMANNVFTNVSGPKSSLQVVSNYASLFIDRVGSEIRIIAENRLGRRRN